MITDYLLTFSDKQNVTATTVSTDIVDLGPVSHGNTERDLGVGEPLYLVVTAQSGFATGTIKVDINTGTTSGAVTTLVATSKEV